MATKNERFEFGEFSVEPQVLEEIAQMAAGKVEGVADIAGGVGGRLAKRSSGVTATRVDDSIGIEVHIVAEYGRPLKEVARRVQAAISEAIQSMIGRPAATVDVFIDGLAFPRTEG